MICPSCGAEISNDSKKCEFCGTPVTAQMRKEQELVNKSGCPKCGSSNIEFTRERQGEIVGASGKKIVHATVGFCKDCGHTWNTNVSHTGDINPNAPKQVMLTQNNKKNSSMLWWVLGWLCFFPIPVMILIWRKKNTWSTKVKLGVTIAFWVIFLIIGASGSSDDKNENKDEQPVAEESVVEDSSVEDTNVEEDVTVEEENEETILDVKIEPNVNADDGTVLFGVTVDLPEDTKLVLKITNDAGYEAEQTVTILAIGTGYTAEFDENGAGLSGDYTVTVTDSDDKVIATQDFTF